MGAPSTTAASLAGLRRLLGATAAAAVLAGCGPSLRLTRPTPARGDLGGARTFALAVTTDMQRAAETSVLTGILKGEVPLPVPVHEVLRSTLTSRLQSMGFTLCPAAPCGDGTLTARLSESSVNTELVKGGLLTHVRLKADVALAKADGTTPYDFNFRVKRNGPPERAPALVVEACEAIAEMFEETLRPGSLTVTLPLEDGGPLSVGVNMLLSGNTTGAIDSFGRLTQEQPHLAGAWYDLGVAYEVRGEWGPALVAYEQAAARERKQHYLDAARDARRNAGAQSSGQ